MNTVVPGIIETPVWRGLLGTTAAEETLASMAGIIPVGRVGSADDVAKAVAFLIEGPA